MTWKCKNPNCEKLFHVLGRISIEKRALGFGNPEVLRVIVEKPCCPFCESVEFELVKEV